MAVLSADTSAKFNIVVASDHSFNFEFYRVAEGTTSPVVPWTGIHQIVISRDAAGKHPKMTLVESNGIFFNTDNTLLTIDRTKVLNTLKPGDYFFKWRTDFSNGYSEPVGKGTFTVNP